jgi:hypothetical protein
MCRGTEKGAFPVLLKTAALLAAAASMAAASDDGVLQVKTDPEGVEVWVDDKYVGDSPIIDKKLKPGRYTVRLVDPVQHASATEEVFIQAGQTTSVEKTLTARFGSLRVDSDPQGAEVSISTPLGKTPLANDLMNPGKYRLEIKHPNKHYEKAVEEIEIPRGQAVSLSKTLEKKSPFNNKALLRLGLGAGTAVGYVLAVIEQGEVKRCEAANKSQDANTAATWRTIGVVVGSACLVGLEIVAFF